MGQDLDQQSSRHAQVAKELFNEWLAELPDGPLHSHIQRLSDEVHGNQSSNVNLLISCDHRDGFWMSGTWLVDGRREIIGPYVRVAHRKKGGGRWALESGCMSALDSPDLYVLAPATEYWATEKLAALGFNQIDTYLPGGAGDHRAFHGNQSQRASLTLSRAGEPHGRGSWTVRLENDDVTSFDCVVRTLARVLDLNDELAYNFALLVHFDGHADIRYCRTERGARKLAERIMKLARMDDFPLTANVVRR